MNSKKLKSKVIRITEVKKNLGFALSCMLLLSIGLHAQQTPEPPTTPKTTVMTTKSYHSSTETDVDDSLNSSVSISISDDSYKFRSSFHKSKNEGVKNRLTEALGKSNLKVSGSTYVWTGEDSGEVFECKLTKEKLRIFVDRELASDAFVEKIKSLGEDLKVYISGSKGKDEKRALEEAQRALKRAERELDRAKREADRAAGKAKRAG